MAIKRIFEKLDGCPKPGAKQKEGGSRHYTMTACAYELACLVAEGELPEKLAREAYEKAAEGIKREGRYSDPNEIQRRLDDAFADVGGR
jgi:hypothetical protein